MSLWRAKKWECLGSVCKSETSSFQITVSQGWLIFISVSDEILVIYDVSKYSSESKLILSYLCSIRIRTRTRDKSKKSTQP